MKHSVFVCPQYFVCIASMAQYGGLSILALLGMPEAQSQPRRALCQGLYMTYVAAHCARGRTV